MARQKRKTVLIVDDDPQIRKLLREIVRDLGHRSLEAGDGAMAIDAFNKGPVHLVITDILMPEKDGIETIMEMRTSKPEVPIVAISGGGRLTSGVYLSIAERLGVAKTMAKPIDTG
ncbi:MAG: response regulator, partial [Desulfatitalea sp.]|nr:response regulator [Desulfatitalea sp.]NNK00049.1 response regulator [Desulfatitalea sp.]